MYNTTGIVYVKDVAGKVRIRTIERTNCGNCGPGSELCFIPESYLPSCEKELADGV